MQILEGRIADCEQKIALIIRDIEDLATIWESFKKVKAQVEVLYSRLANQLNCRRCGKMVAKVGARCICGTVHEG